MTWRPGGLLRNRERSPTPANWSAGDEPGTLRLLSWRDPKVVAVAFAAMAAGFGQFGAVASLGDVAKSFGHLTHGTTVAEQAGLSGTVLGVGLAVFRVASLGGLPITGYADRIGRRRTLLVTAAAGLLLTVGAALSPSYWWFVAIFALGRPLLSATAGIAQVMAAELTGSADRAKAVALITAAYAGGAGLTAVLHGAGEGTLGFRGVFALAIVPFLCLPLIGRYVVEPERFSKYHARKAHPILGAIDRDHRARFSIVFFVLVAVSFVSTPATGFLFLYAQNVVRVSGAGQSLMVLCAGATGLGGLLIGRYLADHWGRRATVAIGFTAVICFATFTYSGGKLEVLIGYPLGALAGGIFAPAAGSLVNELFPTSVRASVAGWLIAASVFGAVAGLVLFGTVADVDNRFSLAGVLTFLPALPISALLWLLPETKGTEPEDLWDTPIGGLGL